MDVSGRLDRISGWVTIGFVCGQAAEAAMIEGPFKTECIETVSKIGNQIVHPCTWSVKDDGAALYLTTADKWAIFNILTFTVEGTGTFEEFQELIASYPEGEWQECDWMEVEFVDGVKGKKRHFVPITDDSDAKAYRVYALCVGECYHSIVVSSSHLMMELNGEAYEEILRSFRGISKVP